MQFHIFLMKLILQEKKILQKKKKNRERWWNETVSVIIQLSDKENREEVKTNMLGFEQTRRRFNEPCLITRLHTGCATLKRYTRSLADLLDATFSTD